MCVLVVLYQNLQQEVTGRGADLGEVGKNPQSSVGDGPVMCRLNTEC